MPQADHSLSIGVIDPDRSSRSAVARLLLAHGYASRSYASLAEYEADLAAAHPAALIFIDAAAWLRAGAAVRERALDASVVVALGAEARIEQVGRALASGCFDYLVRPVPPALLRDVVTQAAGQAGHALGWRS